jgi:hypothetical protein
MKCPASRQHARYTHKSTEVNEGNNAKNGAKPVKDTGWPRDVEPAGFAARLRDMRMLTSFVLMAFSIGGICACGASHASGGEAPQRGRGSAAPASSADPSASSQPTSPAPPRPGGGTPTILTETDNATTIRLSPGDSVTVELKSRSPFSWHIPAASGSGLRRTSASGGYPSRRPARASFLAVKPGRAGISSIDDAACLHGDPPCMLAQQSWQVTIIVGRATS